MSKSMIICSLLVVATIIQGKPNPQGATSQLTVLPHVETVNHVTVDGSSSSTANPALLSAVSGSPPSKIGIHLEEVHDVQTDTGAPNPRTSVAQCPRFYKPVCGSDNKTYNTECELNQAQSTDSSLTKAKIGPC